MELEMHRLLRALALGLLIGLLGLLVAPTPLGRKAEEDLGLYWLFKARGPIAPPDEVAIVSLDRASATRLGLPEDPHYWPRSGRARLIDRLVEAGATVIVFDMFLHHETDHADDIALADAMARSERVILLTRLVPVEVAYNDLDMDDAGIGIRTLPTLTLVSPNSMFDSAPRAKAPFPLPKDYGHLDHFWAFIAELGDRATIPAVALQIQAQPVLTTWNQILADAGVASADLPPADLRLFNLPGEVPRTMQQIRRAFLSDTELATRLDHAITARWGEWDSRERVLVEALARLYAGPDARYLNFYGPPGHIRTVSYADVVEPRPGTATGAALRDFAEKVVFVGNAERTPALNSDTYNSVFSTVDGIDISGVEVAATAFVNLMHGTDLQIPGIAAQATLLMLSGLTYGFAAYLLPTAAAFGFGVVVGVAQFAGTCVLFSRFYLWAPIAVPLLIQLPAALVAGLLWQQRNINRGLRSYLSPEVAARIRTCALDLQSTNQPLYGVCLATDVQGYTTLSETLQPNALAGLMNEYFEALFEPVVRRNGIVTGIAGDGVMSVWAAPNPDTLARGQAALAALDSLRRIDAFNETHAPRILPTRFGLNAGWMVLGNVGGAGHFAYNAVGDIPNTASRIESLNKRLGTRILATEEVADSLRHLLVRRIGVFRLKGKSDAVSVYEILCPLTSASAPDQLRCEAYAQALSCFEDRRWSTAEQRFEALLDEFPGDGPARFMLGVCQHYQTCPPSPEADTVIRLLEK
jgi:adenylate cyclase